MSKDLRNFSKVLESNPDLIASLKRTAEMMEFREKYNVHKPSPLKCPACSQYGYSGGSLYFNLTETHICVCRKCRTEFRIDCLNMTNEDLIKKVREMVKEGKPLDEE